MQSAKYKKVERSGDSTKTKQTKINRSLVIKSNRQNKNSQLHPAWGYNADVVVEKMEKNDQSVQLNKPVFTLKQEISEWRKQEILSATVLKKLSQWNNYNENIGKFNNSIIYYCHNK